MSIKSTNLVSNEVAAEGWIALNGVPTFVRTWGGWIENEIYSDTILLFITGNPGITDFYINFLATLYNLTQFPVWVLCHTGHETPGIVEGLQMPSLNENKELFNLAGQIKHKKDFIAKYIPSTKNIYLIGHSVGSKVLVELLKFDDIAKRTVQAHLLFPTLENIAATPNGWAFSTFTKNLAPLLILLAWHFHYAKGSNDAGFGKPQAYQ